MASEPSMPPPSPQLMQELPTTIIRVVNKHKFLIAGVVFVVIVFIVVMINISSDEPSPTPSPSPEPSPEPADDPDPDPVLADDPVPTLCDTPSNGSWNIATPTAPSSIPTSNVTCITGYNLVSNLSTLSCDDQGNLSPTTICSPSPVGSTGDPDQDQDQDPTPCDTPSYGSWSVSTPTAPSSGTITISTPSSYVTCTHGHTSISSFTCAADGSLSPTNICSPSPVVSVNNTCTATDPNASPSTITANDGANNQFTCLPGYNGAAPMRCNNGNFDDTHSCVPSQCQPTQVLHSNNNYNIPGSITGNFESPAITITCEAGYTGGGDVTCQPSGTFNTITCDAGARGTCAPTTIPNASPSTIPTGTYGDSTIINNCINTHEFYNSSSITATCGSDGQYTIVGECALKNCLISDDPNQVDLTTASPSPNYLYCQNGQVTYAPIDITGVINNGCECTCNDYPGTGTSGITWTGTYCEIPPSCPSTQVPNSDHQSPGSITGNIESSSISITCDPGYTGSGDVTCEYNDTTSTLSFTDITCTGLPCIGPQIPPTPNQIDCNDNGTPTGTYSDDDTCRCICGPGFTGDNCDIRYCMLPTGFNWDTDISTPTAPTTGTAYYPLTNVTCFPTNKVINYNPDSLSYSELMAGSSTWWDQSDSPGHVTCDPSGVTTVTLNGSSGRDDKCVTIDEYFRNSKGGMTLDSNYPYYIIDYNAPAGGSAQTTNFHSILWKKPDNEITSTSDYGYCGLPDNSTGNLNSMKPFHCVGFDIGNPGKMEGTGQVDIDYLFPLNYKDTGGYNYQKINKRINISPIIASLYGQERRSATRVPDGRYDSYTRGSYIMPPEINWTGTSEGGTVPTYAGGFRYEEHLAARRQDSTSDSRGAGRLKKGRMNDDYDHDDRDSDGSVSAVQRMLPSFGTAPFHPVDSTNPQGQRTYNTAQYFYAAHCDQSANWYDTTCWNESALQIWGISNPSGTDSSGQYTGTNKNLASKGGAQNNVKINRTPGTCVAQKTIHRPGHGTDTNTYTCKWNSMDELYHKISPTQPPAQRFKLTRDDNYITYEYDDLIGLNS